MSTLPSKQKLQEIRIAIQTALDNVAKEQGINSIKLGNIRYDESGFKAAIEAMFEGGGESSALKDLRLNARYIGFAPEIAGAEITYGKKKYQVTGFKRTNFTLLCLEDKKTYTAKVEIVRNALKLQKSPLVIEEQAFSAFN